MTPAVFPLVYRPTWVGRIVLLLVGLPLVALGVLMPFTLQTQAATVGLYVIFIVMALVGIFFAGQALFSKVILDRDALSVASIFGTRRVDRRQVIGYRRSEGGLTFYTDAEAVRGFLVPASYTYDETFNKWVDSLRSVPINHNKAAVVQVDTDDRYGPTVEHRRRKLVQLRRITIGSTCVGVGAAMWAVAYPHPVWLAIGLPIALPCVALFIVVSSGGLITFHEFDKVEAQKKGLLAGMVTGPGFGLALVLSTPVYGLPQWPEAFQPVLLAGVIGGAVLTFLMFLTSKSIKSSVSAWLVMAGFMTLHVAASTAMLNGLADSAAPDTHRFVVQGKHHTNGRGATYWLETTPASPGNGVAHMSLEVSPVLYFKAQVDSTVCQRVHPGAFHWAWLSVDDCN
jgi:hypothetical protein